jgi:hypothetical protein
MLNVIQLIRAKMRQQDESNKHTTVIHSSPPKQQGADAGAAVGNGSFSSPVGATRLTRHDSCSPGFQRNLSHSTLVAGPCWLCTAQPACPFVLFESEGVHTESGAYHVLKTSITVAQVPSSALCLRCFMLGYKAVVQPILAVNEMAAGLARRIDVAVAADKEGGEPGVLAADRESLAKSGTGWTCARCTYQNGADAMACGVCCCVSPRVVQCQICQCQLFNGTSGNRGDMTFCKVANRSHEVWECDRCTVMNTISGDVCQTCQTNRQWNCGRCNVPNRGRRDVNRERFCFACGFSDVSLTESAMFQMGINPADMKREQQQQEELDNNQKRLRARLVRLGVAAQAQVGDGNCQFRSLANQLFCNAELHMLVRHIVTEYMLAQHGFFAMLFETEREFVQYVEGMKMPGTWGDEITLRAAADALGVVVHVITSDTASWHKCFTPDDDGEKATACGAVQHPSAIKNLRVVLGPSAFLGESVASADSEAAGDHPPFPHVFLSYCYPVHYDDVRQPPPVPSICRTLVDVLRAVERDEDEWVEAASPSKQQHDGAGAGSGSSNMGGSKVTSDDWVTVPPPPAPYSPRADATAMPSGSVLDGLTAANIDSDDGNANAANGAVRTGSILDGLTAANIDSEDEVSPDGMQREGCVFNGMTPADIDLSPSAQKSPAKSADGTPRPSGNQIDGCVFNNMRPANIDASEERSATEKRDGFHVDDDVVVVHPAELGMGASRQPTECPETSEMSPDGELEVKSESMVNVMVKPM